MESEFCVSALSRSLQVAKPEIFNTDQGSQFTSCAFTEILKEREIAISMDGRGRALDNVFVERLWRSVKYEDIYIKDYETAPQAITGLGRYFKFYNRERLHQSLDYKTPEAVYRLTA
jgi:putative transposase